APATIARPMSWMLRFHLQTCKPPCYTPSAFDPVNLLRIARAGRTRPAKASLSLGCSHNLEHPLQFPERYLLLRPSWGYVQFNYRTPPRQRCPLTPDVSIQAFFEPK